MTSTVGPGAPSHAAIDPATGVPLYLQVERSLAGRIEAGEWAADQRIPAEEQLCQQYGVSRITMRQAIGRLVDRALLVRERGRGTYVRDQSLTAGARGVTSFTAEIAQLGLQAGSRMLGVDVVAAGEADLAPEMRLEPDQPVVRIRRVRTGGGRPIGVQTSLLPAERFPGLEQVELEGMSLYAVLRDRYGVVPVEAVETFTVGGVLAEDAANLEVSPGAHAFYVERVTFDARGPFEHVRSVMRGDRYRVRLALRNP